MSVPCGIVHWANPRIRTRPAIFIGPASFPSRKQHGGHWASPYARIVGSESPPAAGAESVGTVVSQGDPRATYTCLFNSIYELVSGPDCRASCWHGEARWLGFKKPLSPVAELPLFVNAAVNHQQDAVDQLSPCPSALRHGGSRWPKPCTCGQASSRASREESQAGCRGKWWPDH